MEMESAKRAFSRVKQPSVFFALDIKSVSSCEVRDRFPHRRPPIPIVAGQNRLEEITGTCREIIPSRFVGVIAVDKNEVRPDAGCCDRQNRLRALASYRNDSAPPIPTSAQENLVQALA